jgi:predicted nicotinamide N-methyase
VNALNDPQLRRHFILDNTTLIAPAHVPEIRLLTASHAHELWHRTEEELQAIGLPPPFWAFAWAGGQGLARFLLDHPQIVRKKRVLDFASGSGLVAIAAYLSGASHVVANDVDPFSQIAVAENAFQNNSQITFDGRDLLSMIVGEPGCCLDGFDLVLAGDVFYDRCMSGRVLEWMKRLKSAGQTILVGDPGRSYFPHSSMTCKASYLVPVTRELEDHDVKNVSVYEYTG